MQAPARRMWRSAFVALALTFAPVASASSQEIEQRAEHADQAPTEIEQAANQGVNDEPPAGPFGLSADWWIAVFTAVLTLSTSLLWLDTRRLAKHAEIEARESRRPILLMRIGFDDPAMWDTRSVIVRGHLKNVGAQPAYIYSLVVEAVLLAPDAPAPVPIVGAPPLSDRGLQRSLITGMLILEVDQPEDEGWFLDYWPRVPFTASDREAYLAGDLEVYFTGVCEYADANANLRELGFCYKLVRYNTQSGEPAHLERVLNPQCNFDRAKKKRSPASQAKVQDSEASNAAGSPSL